MQSLIFLTLFNNNNNNIILSRYISSLNIDFYVHHTSAPSVSSIYRPFIFNVESNVGIDNDVGNVINQPDKPPVEVHNNSNGSVLNIYQTTLKRKKNKNKKMMEKKN